MGFNWEKECEKESLTIARKWAEQTSQKSDQQTLENLSISGTMMLTVYIGMVNERKLKKKLTVKQLESLLIFFYHDYFLTLKRNEIIMELFQTEIGDLAEWEERLLRAMNLREQEKHEKKECEEKEETYFHSLKMLEKMGFKKEEQTEEFVLLFEEVKDMWFTQCHNNILRFHKKEA